MYKDEDENQASAIRQFQGLPNSQSNQVAQRAAGEQDKAKEEILETVEQSPKRPKPTPSLTAENYEHLPKSSLERTKANTLILLAFQAVARGDLALLSLLMDYHVQIEQKDQEGIGEKICKYDALEKQETIRVNILKAQAEILLAYKIKTLNGFNQLNQELKHVIQEAKLAMRTNYNERIRETEPEQQEKLASYEQELDKIVKELILPQIENEEEAKKYAEKTFSAYQKANEKAIKHDRDKLPNVIKYNKIQEELSKQRHQVAVNFLKINPHFLPENMTEEEFIEKIQEVNLSFTICHPDTNETLLYHAIRHHQPFAIIDFLLKHNVPVEAKTKEGPDILTEVVNYGHTAAAWALINHGHFTNNWLTQQDGQGNTLLFYAITKIQDYPLATTLLEKGANLHQKNHAGVTPWQNFAKAKSQANSSTGEEINLQKSFCTLMIHLDFMQRDLSAAILPNQEPAASNTNQNSGQSNKSSFFAQNAHFDLAKQQLPDHFQALPYLYDAIAQEPEHLEIWLELGKCLRALGTNDLAIQVFTAALTVAKKQNTSPMALAQCYVERGLSFGDSKNALQDYDAALESLPLHREALWQKAHLLRKFDLSQAENCCTQYLNFQAKDSDFILLRAEIHCAGSNYDQALHDYQSALALVAPDQAEAIKQKITELSTRYEAERLKNGNEQQRCLLS